MNDLFHISALLSGRWVAENAITNIPAPPSSPIAFDNSVTSLLDYDQKFSRPLKSQSHNHGDLPVTSKRTNLEMVVTILLFSFQNFLLKLILLL